MNKSVVLALGNFIAGLGVVAAVVFLSGNNTQSLPEQLTQLNKIEQGKLLELKQLEQLLKINQIDLISNIDTVKEFINIHGKNTTLHKVKNNKRGIEYLLSGKSIDVLVLLYKANQNELKIDITTLGFKQSDNLIAEITITGTEQ